QEMEMHVLHGDSKLPAEQKEERLKALKRDLEAKIKEILTPAQAEKLKSVHQEVEADLKAAPTEEQRQQVAELHVLLQQKATEINNDASLTPEQKEQRLKELHEMAETHMKV